MWSGKCVSLCQIFGRQDVINSPSHHVGRVLVVSPVYHNVQTTGNWISPSRCVILHLQYTPILYTQTDSNNPQNHDSFILKRLPWISEFSQALLYLQKSLDHFAAKLWLWLYLAAAGWGYSCRAGDRTIAQILEILHKTCDLDMA